MKEKCFNQQLKCILDRKIGKNLNINNHKQHSKMCKFRVKNKQAN